MVIDHFDASDLFNLPRESLLYANDIAQKGICGLRAGRWVAGTFQGVLKIGGGDFLPVVELHAVTQVKGIGLAIAAHLPAFCDLGR